MLLQPILYSFIYSLIHSSIHPFIHLFTSHLLFTLSSSVLFSPLLSSPLLSSLLSLLLRSCPRADSAGGAGQGPRGSHVHRGGPPPLHHPERRLHCRVPEWRCRGEGHTPAAARQAGCLLPSSHLPDGT